MVQGELINAVIATILGIVVAVLLLIPVAAVQYRRDGRLGPGDLALLVTAAVYGIALWVYTLVPMPDGDSYLCAGRQLKPFGTIREISAGGGGMVGLLHDAAFLQVALNVALFVPLGFFVRAILRRGVVATTLLGFGISALIEVTQVTGVWGLYPCPYRVFDVDDLLVNTSGALLGALLMIPFGPRRDDSAAVDQTPRTLTFGRRLVGMVSDLLFVVIVGTVLVIGYRAVQIYVAGTPFDEVDPDIQAFLAWGVPGAVQAILVLAGGRTVGELVVSVRATARSGRSTPVARVLKLVFGVGPMIALLAATPAWSMAVLVLYAAVTVLVAARSDGFRGLSHIVAGMDLQIIPPRPGAFGRKPPQRISLP
jgi:glycopeptide antibiotics resistance protein